MDWTFLHELLVAGEVNYVTGKPQSLWSNVLVLPNFQISDRLKFDAEGKIALSPETVSLRGPRLEGAVLVDAHLRRVDFTGAHLVHARLISADLRGAKFDCNQAGNDRQCTRLQGATLDDARLQFASLDGAQLEGASLEDAKLQGASLNGTQLQGASLDGTRLQGAFLADVFVWKTKTPAREHLRGAQIKRPRPEPAISWAGLRPGGV